MKYKKLDISVKALKVMALMRANDRRLIPYYSRSVKCNRYCVDGDWSRDVSELTLLMKNRLFKCGLIGPLEDGVRWELNCVEHDRLLELIEKRSGKSILCN